MSVAASSGNGEVELRLELYKSLRGEVVSYVERVPGLWLQKFTLVGAVIAFLISKSDGLLEISKGSPVLIVTSFLSVPILAALLDAKIFEYGLHARAISRFIARSFPDVPIVGEWEAHLWGDRGSGDVLALVRLRSLTTVLVTATSTVLLIGLSGLVAGTVYSQHWLLILCLVAVASLVYLGTTAYVWRRVWPQEGK